MLNMSNWGNCLFNDMKTYACDGKNPGLRWAYDAPSGLLINQASGQCMQASGATQGSGISTAPCQPSNSLQQWTRDNNYFRMTSNPSLVAELPSYDYSRSLDVWAANGGGNQAWAFNQ